MACSGVLESAAKTACEASAKAGPAGGLPWQVAVLDAMPLGPTALDYSFTARGELPKVRPASHHALGNPVFQALGSAGPLLMLLAALLQRQSRQRIFLSHGVPLQQAVPEHLKKQNTYLLGLQGVQQSKLAEAFGPEDEEPQGDNGTPGKAERVQIGNALVALLESHRKHRFHPTQPPCRIPDGTSGILQCNTVCMLVSTVPLLPC